MMLLCAHHQRTYNHFRDTPQALEDHEPCRLPRSPLGGPKQGRQKRLSLVSIQILKSVMPDKPDKPDKQHMIYEQIHRSNYKNIVRKETNRLDLLTHENK